MSVTRTLDISTAHLTKDTADWLSGLSLEGWPWTGGATRYGYFMYVPTDHYPAQSREDLEAAFRLARELHCDYVLFDRDADAHPNLPTYEW